MTKSAAGIFFIALLTAGSLSASHHVPPGTVRAWDVEGDFRFFLRRDPVQLMAEVRGVRSGELSGFGYRSVTVGPYVQLLPFLQAGLFYTAQAGAVHDDDWVWESPRWYWKDTAGRWEHVLTADATLRFQPGPGPFRRFVAELKTRYACDFFNSERTLKLRPGLSYFWIRDDRPAANFYLQYELLVPLNYSEGPLFGTYVYAGGLFHVSPWFKAGPFLGYRVYKHGPSAEWLQSYPGQDYWSFYHLFVAGLTLTFMVDL